MLAAPSSNCFKPLLARGIDLIERFVCGPTHSDGALLLRLLQYGNGLRRTDFAQGLDGSLRDKGIVRLDDYRHQIWHT